MRLNTSKLIDAARGTTPADIVFKGASLVNVLSGEIYQTDVAVADGFIVGLGEYTNAVETVDLSGKYILPGLIDGHIHIESSKLTPQNFAGALLPHGTTTVIADPHEIVNVCGLDGLTYMVESAKNIPLDW